MAQPTTPEAVQYSCANIDNRENSPITEWYMQMFGVIPLPAGGHVQAGWDNAVPINARQIITFDNAACAGGAHNTCTTVDDAVAGHNVNDQDADPAEPPITRRQLFIRNFRKIASTSVGRVLLYRILIEIRRHSGAGNNVGCFATDIPDLPPLVNIDERNNARHLEIKWGEFNFDPNASIITFCETRIDFSVIGKTSDNYTHISLHSASLDVSLFHEFLHWYHFLRHIYRYDTELWNNGAIVGLSLNTYVLGQYFWGAILNGAAATMDVSSEKWRDAGNNLAFEEMRTILGVPFNVNLLGVLPFVNGDDISENLFRLCAGIPLRFGYDGVGFYEDNRVIDLVTCACNSCKDAYKCVPRYGVDVTYGYGTAGIRDGLGNCRVLP